MKDNRMNIIDAIGTVLGVLQLVAFVTILIYVPWELYREQQARKAKLHKTEGTPGIITYTVTDPSNITITAYAMTPAEYEAEKIILRLLK